MKRSSGILMAVSSLPSPYGIGTLGKAAYDFADFLKDAGQSYWQMLPLGPTSYGDSPYQSFSAYAGNPYYIDPDILAADGLLTAAECAAPDWGSDPRHVDYGKIYESRFTLLHKAYKRGWERDAEAIAAFAQDNARWLPDYALYMACKRHFGMKAWTEWPDDDLRLRKNEAVLDKYRTLLREDVQFFTYLQFLFFRQWTALRDYVHQQGIRIIGDLPIYVAMDSADVWAEPQFFQLDDDLVPKAVAGVPPDYFTADGQLWGNPLYDWDAMRDDGFGWWIRRIDGAGKLYDVIRIDHFRGFANYWAVPYGQPTAKNGRWIAGPGMDLIERLNGWFPQLEFIAEDLGYPTPEVAQLLRESGWPGMKVLEFAFDSRDSSGYLPHAYTPHCICYTGTHPGTVAAGGRAGGCGPRGGIPGADRAGGLPLGYYPRRYVQRGGAVRGAGAGLSGPGRGKPHEHPRHPGRQLDLAAAARRAERCALCQDRPHDRALRPQGISEHPRQCRGCFFAVSTASATPKPPSAM